MIRTLFMLCTLALFYLSSGNAIAGEQGNQTTNSFRLTIDNRSNMCRDFEYCVYSLNGSGSDLSDTIHLDADGRWDNRLSLIPGMYRLEIYCDGGAAYYEVDFSTSHVGSVYAIYLDNNGRGAFQVHFY